MFLLCYFVLYFLVIFLYFLLVLHSQTVDQYQDWVEGQFLPGKN